ncbi:MAG: protein arginine kinase [Clostridia bacterium]|nr:protein arginine kinase [Clostridia bacterium]MBP3485573.1 protein arginine kinase [Oscillospiraceae bacterium]
MEQSYKWYRLSGPEGAVVLSTRVRLARNLTGLPFPALLTAEQKAAVTAKVRQALPAEETLTYLEMQNMTRMDALSMVERHLISPEFSRCDEGSGLLLSDDESVSLMLCEEDHLRMQVMRPGLQLNEAYEAADRLDTALDEALHFAFDDRLGYLTQCPTNLGTGMRASLMLFLPALSERGAIRQLSNTVSKLGLTIRGWYGEGSKSEGHIYQLSNQVTLGISEQAAMENLRSIALQIIREERAEREKLAADPRYQDAMWRALGILRYARRLTQQEFMELSAYLRVGLATGILTDVGFTTDDLNALMNDAQPATMMMMARRELEPSQRDTDRAAMVRERLS